jgi:hypothetical protein
MGEGHIVSLPRLDSGDIGDGPSSPPTAGFTISTSSVLREDWAEARRRRPKSSMPRPRIKIKPTYAPTMPPIWAGSKARSRDAPRESGGPSSGEGAGSQSMPNGCFDSRVYAARTKGRRSKSRNSKAIPAAEPLIQAIFGRRRLPKHRTAGQFHRRGVDDGRDDRCEDRLLRRAADEIAATRVNRGRRRFNIHHSGGWAVHDTSTRTCIVSGCSHDHPGRAVAPHHHSTTERCVFSICPSLLANVSSLQPHHRWRLGSSKAGDEPRDESLRGGCI